MIDEIGSTLLDGYPAATNTEIWNARRGEWPKEKMLLPEEIADAVAYALSRPADVAVENITLSNAKGSL
jgi:NADP-dependent 3-hydroxy acid dehydrogenase YdfG